MKLSPFLLGAFALHLAAGSASALTPFSDNFTKGSIKKSRWAVELSPKAVLISDKQKVNFTVSGKATDDDYAILALKKNQPGYNESWEMTLDVTNTTNKRISVGIGMQIFNAADPTDVVALEFYGKAGFGAIFIIDDIDNPDLDILQNSNGTKASLKMSFDAKTKLISMHVDKDGSTNGLKWKKIGTFSPTGAGGDRNLNWKMDPTKGKFGIELFAYGENSLVASGQVTLDNFSLRKVK